MQVKFLKNIVEEVTGKQAGEIVDLLANKKDVNEFLIAKKLELTINQTRNILYKLSDFGMISFIRKKDKRKGWYIYFWTLNTFKSLELLGKKIQEEITNLENQLKSRQIKRFYVCKTCDVEVSEESALFQDYTCQECGEIYELMDNEKLIKSLENKVIKLKKELNLIQEEKNKEEEKLDKGNQRKIKKAEKEKKKLAAQARAKRKSAKEKAEKKNPVKKKPKKKAKKKAKPKKKAPKKKKSSKKKK